MDKNKRREIIGKALEVVRRACGGEVKGYAEGGSPKEVLSDAVRSPVPEWLLDQQRSVRDGMPMPDGVERRFPSAAFEPFGDIASFGAEMTGIPSMVRGYGALTGDGDIATKARGAAEIGMGAIPALGITSRGAAALSPLFSSGTRSAATMGALSVPVMAEMIAHPQSAAAQGMQGTSREQVLELQKELVEKGYLPARAADGVMGPATISAAERYRKDKELHAAQKAEENKQQAQIEASRAQTEAAKAATEETRRKAKEAEAADTRRREGEEKLRTIEANVPWYRQALRDYGPPLGYGAGIVLGTLGANKVGGIFDKMAATKSTRANALVGDDFGKARDAEKAARLNQFWVEGQRRPLWGDRAVPYSSNNSGVLTPNPGAPSAGELYLTPRVSEVRGHVTPLLAYGAEAWYGNSLKNDSEAARKEAEKALALDPSDVNIASYQRAKDREAIGDFISNMGRMGAATHAGVAIGQNRIRDRPNISQAEAAKFNLDAKLTPKGAGQTGGTLATPSGSKGPQLQSQPPSEAGTTGSTQSGTGSQQGLKSQSTSGGKSSSESSGRLSWEADPPDNVKLPKDHRWDAILDRPRNVRNGQIAPMPKYTAGKSKASKGNEPPTPDGIPERNFGGHVVEMARRYADGGAVMRAYEPNWIDRMAATVAGDDRDSVRQRVTERLFGTRGAAMEQMVRSNPYNSNQAMTAAERRSLMRDVKDGFADGGTPLLAGDMGNGPLIPHGPVHGPDGGRADTRPVSVPDGAFVIPADIVAALGEGNTQAGFASLDDMFGTAETMHMASGGVPERSIPIMISDGEYVISPAKVMEIGRGDLDVGHKALDKFVLQLREQNIKRLQSLPGPAQT